MRFYQYGSRGHEDGSLVQIFNDDVSRLMPPPTQSTRDQFPLKARLGPHNLYFTEEDLKLIVAAVAEHNITMQLPDVPPVRFEPVFPLPISSAREMLRQIQKSLDAVPTVQDPRAKAESELAHIDAALTLDLEALRSQAPAVKEARIRSKWAARRAVVEERLRLLDAAENPGWS